MAAQPLACDLFALTKEQRHQHAALIEQLIRMIQDVQELADGYMLRWRLDDQSWQTVTDWIQLERRCCPFLTFTLRLEPGEPLALQLTGPGGVKEFLTAELPQLMR